MKTTNNTSTINVDLNLEQFDNCCSSDYFRLRYAV